MANPNEAEGDVNSPKTTVTPAPTKQTIQKIRNNNEGNLWVTADPVRFCQIKAVMSAIEETIRYPFALVKTHQQVFEQPTTSTPNSSSPPTSTTSSHNQSNNPVNRSGDVKASAKSFSPNSFTATSSVSNTRGGDGMYGKRFDKRGLGGTSTTAIGTVRIESNSRSSGTISHNNSMSGGNSSGRRQYYFSRTVTGRRALNQAFEVTVNSTNQGAAHLRLPPHLYGEKSNITTQHRSLNLRKGLAQSSHSNAPSTSNAHFQLPSQSPRMATLNAIASNAGTQTIFRGSKTNSGNKISIFSHRPTPAALRFFSPPSTTCIPPFPAPHSSAVPPAPRQTFTYARHVVSTLGWQALFRGYLWCATPAVPLNVLYFYIYNEVKRVLLNIAPSLTPSCTVAVPNPTGPDPSKRGAASSQTNYAEEDAACDELLTTKTEGLGAGAKFVIAFAAGAIADLICLTFWVPFDVISQHLQLQDIRSFPGAATLISNKATAATPQSNSVMSFDGRRPFLTTSYSRCQTSNHVGNSAGYQSQSLPHSKLSASTVISHIYRHEGLRGFYRGTAVTLLLGVPSSAVWWSTYEMTKLGLRALKVFEPSEVPKSTKIPPPLTGILNPLAPNDNHTATSPSPRSNPNITKHLAPDEAPSPSPPPAAEPLGVVITAGGVAGFAAVVVTNPLDVIKTRIQTSTTPTTKTEHLGPTATPSSGKRSATTSTPGYQISLGTQQRQQWLGGAYQTIPKSTKVGGRCGGSILMSSGDVRRSLEGREHHSGNKGIRGHILHLARKEGFAGFFRGVIPRLGVGIPFSALSLFVYEFTLKFSQRLEPQSGAPLTKACVQ